MSGQGDESCDIMRHHATSCDRERKGVGSGWRKMSFDRRRCRRETRWREQERKAGGSRKRKRKTGGRRKHKGFPLQSHLWDLFLYPVEMRGPVMVPGAVTPGVRIRGPAFHIQLINFSTSVVASLRVNLTLDFV